MSTYRIQIILTISYILINYNNACVPVLDFGDLDINNVSTNNKIFIPPTDTCSSKIKKPKRFFHCFHNGVCQSKFLNLNETHYSQVYFCVCQTVCIHIYIYILYLFLKISFLDRNYLPKSFKNREIGINY